MSTAPLGDGEIVIGRSKPIAEDPAPEIKIGRSRTYDFTPYINAAAKQYNLDPLLIRAVMQQESGGNPWAQGAPVTKANGQVEFASGLMQLMPGTAKDMGVKDPWDPEQNIFGGARYIRQKLDEAKGDVPTALLYYVGGRDPTKWGQHSFAYPKLVMDHYRKLGGRLQDPEVSKAHPAVVAASGIPVPNPGIVAGGAPLIPANEVMARLIHGRGPDLSQGLSGPDRNLPVGQKVRDWWNATGKADAMVEMDRKSIANAQDTAPWSTLGLQAVGGLPAWGLLGGAVNKGLEAVGAGVPALSVAARFLTGNAGYGAPGTREGASFLTRTASNAAQGGVQGAIAGAFDNYFHPEAGLGQNMLTGAAFGAGAGAAVNAVGEGISRTLFGRKMDPAVATLGREVTGDLSTVPPTPPVKMAAKPSHPNQLYITPESLTRAATSLTGNPGPRLAGPAERSAQALALGAKIDEAAKDLYVAADMRLALALNDAAQQLGMKGQPDGKIVRLLREVAHYASNNSGIMPGERLVQLTEKGGLIQRLKLSKIPEVREAGRNIEQAIEEARLRGAQIQIQHATSAAVAAHRAGNPQVAAHYTEQAQRIAAAARQLGEARGQYRSLMTVDEVANPTTGMIDPAKLAGAAAKRSGKIRPEDPLHRLGRAGTEFAPNLHEPWKWASTIPYSAMAVAPSLIPGLATSPIHTGMAAAGVLGASGLAWLVKKAVAELPGYARHVLRRSARVGQNPLQAVINQAGVPLMTPAGVRYTSPD